MSWSTNIVWAGPRIGRLGALAIVAVCLAGISVAQQLQVPNSVKAGSDATISASGSGKATLYLTGPGVSRKSEVTLGQGITLGGQDLQKAGRYEAIVCADACHAAAFYVIAAVPASLTFLVHPSRVPVSQNDAVSGVAIAFDQFHNLVLAPDNVNFELLAGNASILSRSVRTQNGVAWFRANSGKTAGPVQVVATAGSISAKRAIRQVASEPCHLRIKGDRTSKGIELETEPVRDCSGNPVPDGTIVSFSATGADGKSTVDAPIKQGVARAKIEASGPTVISAASGVVMGNELRIGK